MTCKKERLDYAKMINNVCYTFPIKRTSVIDALKCGNWFLNLLEQTSLILSGCLRIKQISMGQSLEIKLD